MPSSVKPYLAMSDKLSDPSCTECPSGVFDRQIRVVGVHGIRHVTHGEQNRGVKETSNCLECDVIQRRGGDVQNRESQIKVSSA